MSTLREAAQQALEAMLNFPDDISDEMFAAIAALKSALAQQAEPTGKQSLQVDHGLNMNTPQAAQRLLDALAAALPHAPLCAEFDRVADAADDLRAALKREEEALAWLEERKRHWRRERERMQDPELSAALGHPGGISDPVLDRAELLRMVAEMRLAQLAAPQ